MDKPYTTYEEQIEILAKKQLVIEDKAEAVDLLKRCSYYGLIAGYKHPFKDKTGVYKAHTTIRDIYALYKYDVELRELFLKNILTIENHIKSLLSYSFCETYGEAETAYLNATNYDYTLAKQGDINKLIGKLKQAMDDCDSHPYLLHQREKHGNIPLWALTRVLTLGVVSKMYSLLKPRSQTMISKEFEYVSEEELAQMIDLLSRFRNVCAHNERLYDYKYLRGEIRTTDVHNILGLKKNGRYFLQGKKDLFAVVICFKYLLTKNDFELFTQKLSTVLDELLSETRVIQREQILKLMGFPQNWKQINSCDKKIDR